MTSPNPPPPPKPVRSRAAPRARAEARPERGFGMPFWGRALVALLVVAATAVVWVLNVWLSDSFTLDTRNRAEMRLVLYAGNIESELQRTQVVPILLARDPVLREGLQSSLCHVSQVLIGLQAELGTASIELVDARAAWLPPQTATGWALSASMMCISSMRGARTTRFST
jgi:C4-dicarboxylate-specific signal transduction histidine kinase